MHSVALFQYNFVPGKLHHQRTCYCAEDLFIAFAGLN